MNIRNRIAIFVVALAILAASGWWLRARAASGANNAPIETTGTIEARKAALSSQIGGQVAQVLVEEGQSVKASQPLIRLDDSLLQAQRRQAVAALNVAQSAASTADAALASAQNQYNLALQASLVTDKTFFNQWLTNRPSDYNLPVWYYSQSEQMNAAQAEVSAAQQALTDAQNNLTAIESSITGNSFVQGEANLANAEAAYNVAHDLNNRIQNGVNIDQLTRYGLYQLAKQQNYPPTKTDYLINANNIDQNIKDYSQELFDNAKANLKDAQNAYNDAFTSQGAKDVLKARAEVSLEQERYTTAMNYVSYIQTGSMSPAVATAQAALNQAKAADDQARNAVEQTQANVDLIDTQISKLTIYSPTNGVVLTRSAEVGQMALPGATLIEIGHLDQLELTVYLPEEKFGLVAPGQAVQARVDAYPNRVFEGTVLRMSNEAEFTPTNVQTKDDRTRLVYAVVIGLDNPELALKPGMIADVEFANGGSE